MYCKGSSTLPESETPLGTQSAFFDVLLISHFFQTGQISGLRGIFLCTNMPDFDVIFTTYFWLSLQNFISNKSCVRIIWSLLSGDKKCGLSNILHFSTFAIAIRYITLLFKRGCMFGMMVNISRGSQNLRCYQTAKTNNTKLVCRGEQFT